MAPKDENKKKEKAMVPRKKLQSVPDLLTHGDEDSSAAESTTSKILWMTFLVIMFYLSFEIFLRLNRVEDAGSGSSKSEF